MKELKIIKKLRSKELQKIQKNVTKNWKVKKFEKFEIMQKIEKLKSRIIKKLEKVEKLPIWSEIALISVQTSSKDALSIRLVQTVFWVCNWVMATRLKAKLKEGKMLNA